MSDAAFMTPIAFEPAMEREDPREASAIAGLDATLRRIQELVLSESGHAARSVHAKSHGILNATLTVPDDLPAVYRQGLFAQPGRYAAVMRFSTIPGDVLSDDVSTPRGLAVKVIGVEGARLAGSEGHVTQDFVMANSPAFAAPTPRKFLASLKLLARTTNRFEGFKESLSHVARAAEALLESAGRKSALISTLGGQRASNILGETFYSQTPYLFGPYYGKFSLKPVSPALMALARQRVPVRQRPNALREAVIHHFDHDGGEWALQVQLATDPKAMPLENASVAWPESKSAYFTVGYVSAAAQNAWSDEKQRAVDDGLSFSPWHGLAAHRPLGGVNRARRDTYRNSAAFRGQHTGCPMSEPVSGLDV